MVWKRKLGPLALNVRHFVATGEEAFPLPGYLLLLLSQKRDRIENSFLVRLLKLRLRDMPQLTKILFLSFSPRSYLFKKACYRFIYLCIYFSKYVEYIFRQTHICGRIFNPFYLTIHFSTVQFSFKHFFFFNQPILLQLYIIFCI